MPDRNALFTVQFSNVDEFLLELAQDLEDKAVEGNLVRLTHSRRPTANRVNFHKAHYIDAAYTTSTRNQLVHLSHYCGFEKTNTDDTPLKNPDPGTRATLLKVEEVGRRVKGKLLGMGVTLRPGGLFIEGHAEPVDRDHERDFVTNEVICQHCKEPIYFANDLWRHVNDRKAVRTRKEPCDKCDGSGQRHVATAIVRCTCMAGVREVFDHDATPREAREAMPEPEPQKTAVAAGVNQTPSEGAAAYYEPNTDREETGHRVDWLAGHAFCTCLGFLKNRHCQHADAEEEKHRNE